jgi:YD repeat-containing protein
VDNTNYQLDEGQNKRGEVRSLTDDKGNITRYEYDVNGNIRCTIYPDRTSEYKYYDNNRNVIQSIDRLGRHTYSVYDENSNKLIIQAEPIDGFTPFDKETSDYKNFLITQYEYYDATTGIGNPAGIVGLLKKETPPQGDATTYTYDERGNTLTESVSINGKTQVTTYTYDVYNRVLTETDPHGVKTTNVYNQAGNLLRATVSKGNTSMVNRTVYDSLGRVVKSVSPNNYKANQDSIPANVSGIFTGTDEYTGNKATVKGYNQKGLKVSETDPLGRTTAYEYNDAGAVVKEIFPNDSYYRYEYDNSGRQVKTFYKESGKTEILLEESSFGRKAGNSTTTTKVHFDNNNNVTVKYPDVLPQLPT